MIVLYVNLVKPASCLCAVALFHTGFQVLENCTGQDNICFWICEWISSRITIYSVYFHVLNFSFSFQFNCIGRILKYVWFCWWALFASNIHNVLAFGRGSLFNFTVFLEVKKWHKLVLPVWEWISSWFRIYVSVNHANWGTFTQSCVSVIVQM